MTNDNSLDRRRQLIAEATAGMSYEHLLEVLHYARTYPVTLSPQKQKRVDNLLTTYALSEEELVDETEHEVGGVLVDTPRGSTEHHTRLWERLEDEVLEELAQDAPSAAVTAGSERA